MEDKMMFFYDKERDVLDVSIGEPKKALSRETGNDIIVSIQDNEVVGFTILNFEKRSFSKPFNIPVKTEMKLEA